MENRHEDHPGFYMVIPSLELLICLVNANLLNILLLLFRSVAAVIGSRPREGHKTDSKSFELMLLMGGVCTHSGL